MSWKKSLGLRRKKGGSKDDSYDMSVRRACKVLNFARSMYYYDPHPKTDRDVEIADVLSKWVQQFPHYGFWMLYYRLRIFGYSWNHKPVYRVYKSLKLNLRKPPKRKLPKRDPLPMEVPSQIDQVWSMDFCSDSFAGGSKFRVLNIMEDLRPKEESCSGEALASEADTSISSKRVIRVLDQLLSYRNKPDHIRVDNGPEFIADALKNWAEEKEIELAFIDPGKPTQNGFVERLNGTLRREALNRFWFEDLDQVRQRIDEWMIEYNRFRPHKGLGYLSPDLFVQMLNQASNKMAA